MLAGVVVSTDPRRFHCSMLDSAKRNPCLHASKTCHPLTTQYIMEIQARPNKPARTILATVPGFAAAPMAASLSNTVSAGNDFRGGLRWLPRWLPGEPAHAACWVLRNWHFWRLRSAT